jgi:hypothetical protein
VRLVHARFVSALLALLEPAADLAAAVWWPLAAAALVLLGMTFASSGGRRGSTPAERRESAPLGTSGGRRATDRLPGERTMVVITGETSTDTIRTALTSARHQGAHVVVPDAGGAADFRA